MSFIISKLVWALLTPGTLLFLIAATSLWLFRRAPAISRRLLALVTLVLAMLVISPVGAWLLRPLETRYSIPTLTETPVDGIVVLGGSMDANATTRAGAPVLNDGAERLTAFVALARRYPKAKLVFSGGSGDPRHPEIREADSVQPLFDALGLAPGRVIYERDSRNTHENSIKSFHVAQPKSGENWLLVTSAWHMPRAMACFEQAGWKMIAYPVDYRSYNADGWLEFLPDQQLSIATTALREWVGLISYRMIGYTDTVFPITSENSP